MATIGEIAKQLNRSKQAIQSRISKEPLKGLLEGHISSSGQTKIIDEEGVRIILLAYRHTDKQTSNRQTNKQAEPTTDKQTDKQSSEEETRSATAFSSASEQPTNKPTAKQTNEQPTNSSGSDQAVQAVIDALKEQLDIKDKQLAAKDKQLDALLQQLQDITRALHTEQALHAGTIQTALTSGSSIEQGQDAEETIQSVPAPPVKDKGLFSRLFRKRG